MNPLQNHHLHSHRLSLPVPRSVELLKRRSDVLHSSNVSKYLLILSGGSGGEGSGERGSSARKHREGIKVHPRKTSVVGQRILRPVSLTGSVPQDLTSAAALNIAGSGPDPRSRNPFSTGHWGFLWCSKFAQGQRRQRIIWSINNHTYLSSVSLALPLLRLVLIPPSSLPVVAEFNLSSQRSQDERHCESGPPSPTAMLD